MVTSKELTPEQKWALAKLRGTYGGLVDLIPRLAEDTRKFDAAF
jgi:hypothetical protein